MLNMVSENNPSDELENQKISYNCCSINICGLSERSKFSLEKYCYDKSIDILLVQESFSSDPSTQELRFMKSISDENHSNNRGALILVNTQKLDILPLPEISQLSKNIDTAWGLITGRGIRQIVGSVYLKLGYKDAVNDIVRMLAHAKSLGNKLGAKGTSVFGDFNARHLLWGDTLTNSYGMELANKLDFLDYALSSSNGPTFLSVNGNSHIDLLISSINTEQNFSALSTDPDAELFSGAPIRGHIPVLCKFSSECSTKAPTAIPKLDISTIDWQIWSQAVENTLMEQNGDYHANIAPRKKWDLLNDAIHHATVDCGKYKKSSVHSKPFWTEALSEASKALRDAKRAYGKRNTIGNKEALDTAKEYFDDMRKNECQKFLLMKTKSLNVAQATQFWKNFNRLFSNKNRGSVETLIDDHGKPLIEPEEMEENLFASFFACKHLNVDINEFDDVFMNEVEKLYSDILKDTNNPTYSPKSHSSALMDKITSEEVQHFIKQYDVSGKSMDNFEFHPSMMKHLGHLATSRLVDLYNSCMDNGTWVWDIADVIFLKKDGKTNYTKSGSYRPISITSYIGKIFEQIIASRLELHLESCGIYDENQEGFSKRKNTIRYLNRL